MKLFKYFTFFLFFSCKSNNIENIYIIESSNIPEIIINDYSKSMKKYFNKYDVFQINLLNGSNDTLKFYSVLPENDTFVYTIKLNDDFQTKLPSHYKVYKEKIFIWRENNFIKTSDSVFKFMYQNKMIDSSYVKYQLGQISEDKIEDNKIVIDESLKGIIYIFDLKKSNNFIKKIKTEKYIDFNDKKNIVKYGL